MARPIVALVGRTNVGKSTLLNRIVGARYAVVDDQPNVTRDRLFFPVTWQDRDVIFVDTGGWGIDTDTTIAPKVRKQAELAVAQADVVVLVTAATDGVIASDEEAAALVRAAGKPCILVVNKIDTSLRDALVPEFYKLGISTVVPVSALHNRGMSELEHEVVKMLPPAGEPEVVREGLVRVAIVGRPNAGKSTLLNALLGDERAIVDATPGTTRDSLDAYMEWQGKHLQLVDTAGIRKRTRVSYGVDYFSVLRSLHAIDRSDIALLVLDATDPATAQDVNIARYVVESGRGLIIVVNKWDLIEARHRESLEEWMKRRLPFLSFVPVLHVSALKDASVKRVLQGALDVAQSRERRLSRSTVDKAIQEAVEVHAPPRVGTRRLDIIWAHQDEENPWTFVVHVNDPILVPAGYERYLEHHMRRRFGYRGVPLHFNFVPAGRPRRADQGQEAG
ncbi:MAG: ribosome biogenesis GTPase Der [Dehalococcoidia bacterium]|nr:ribosome biogenesis GTPase Der [Dehalococcoidia bacterium]